MNFIPNTVIHPLQQRAEVTPSLPAFHWKDRQHGWRSIDWQHTMECVHHLSCHLIAKGLRPGNRVAIMMPTSPIWEYCNLAVLGAGAVTVGIDAHDTDENLRHILATTQPQAVFTTTENQLERLCALLPRPPVIRLLTEGNTEDSVNFNALISAEAAATNWPLCRPDSPATVIFTSGTTGQPKGIVYTHAQICLAAEAILNQLPLLNTKSRFACWLPLYNLFQRIANICAMRCGAQSWFIASPSDIVAHLPDIQPTFFIGVPRFYEKLYNSIQAYIDRRPAYLRRLIRSAWKTGIRYQTHNRTRQQPGFGLTAAYRIADSLVLGRLRAATFGNQLEFMLSGSAPLPAWLLEQFHGLGWPILEAYGISENVIPIAMNTPEDYRFGSVGRPLPQHELRFAEDDELLIRGPGVFGGYLGNNDQQAVLDREGFLHTGDFAQLDEDGYLWLIGRKSDVFKTSTGKRVAPQPVEAALKRLSYVEYAMLTGAGRPVPVAVLNIAESRLPQTIEGPIPASILRSIAADIQKVCTDLPPAMRPAGAIVTRREFSISAGDLTANLKLKRKTIETTYEKPISRLYESIISEGRKSGCLVLEADEIPGS